jgi:hypothetical protein
LAGVARDVYVEHFIVEHVRAQAKEVVQWLRLDQFLVARNWRSRNDHRVAGDDVDRS